MRLLDAIGRKTPTEVTNSVPSGFQYGTTQYPFGVLTGSNPTISDGTFESMVLEVHNQNGPVSSAVVARALLLSQVQFAWRERHLGFGLTYTPALDQLQFPAGTTRSEMLFRMELDASYAGNAFLARRRGVVHRLDPARVTFAFGSNTDPTFTASQELTLPFDAQVIGIIYNSSGTPGMATGADLEVFLPGEFAHWKPEPDPLHWWRGQSWIASLLEDVALDGQISDHQSKFFVNAGVPNLVFLMNPALDSTQVQQYADVINKAHTGTDNHWKNMFLGGATDVKVVGQDLSKLSLKDLQGGLETRVSMRSRVPAVILGAREGLSGSSLNTGNYSAARRLFADGWFSPTVNGLCEALESLVPPPPSKRLTHDAAEILFLQEDRKDEAEINTQKVTSINTLVNAGFDPATAVETIAPEWSSKLTHAGLLSVQLQEPGTAAPANASDARNVMGRLGRAISVDSIDAVALLDGINPATATLASEVLAVTEATDMKTLRAEMLAALTTGASNA